MALPRIFVVDDSEAVRETLSIVLGSSCDVHHVDLPTCSASFPLPDANPDLLIVNADLAPPALLRAASHSSCPIIWLRADPSLGPPTPGGLGTSVVLAYRLDGHAVADQVARLLRQPQRPQRPRSLDVLSHPYLPAEVAELAAEARLNQLPVLISGEPGTGRARVALALRHGEPMPPVFPLSPDQCSRAHLLTLAKVGLDVTLVIDDIDTATKDTQAFLLELIEAGGMVTPTGWLTIRLVSATGVDLASLAHSGSFSRDLYYRLSVLPITLPPLRDRVHDVPPLARAIALHHCSTMARSPVSFTPRAMRRLANYLWFGNIAELETVIVRTVSLVHKEVIDVEDLLFGYGRVLPPRDDVVRREPEESPADLPHHTVDLIINELAHEFKNPLVTIKTFAQHIDRLLAQDESRQELVRLTGDAVDRIDRTLENLLQFTRFDDPVPQPVPLGALLGPVLRDLGPLLSDRHLVLDYRPPNRSTTVTVDPEQIAYALENLMRALIRSVAEHESIAVMCTDAGHVTVRLPHVNGGDLGKLRTMLHDRPSTDAQLPLGVTLARTLIDRNGGHLDLANDREQASVTVRLPHTSASATEKVSLEDGTPADFDR